MISHANRRLPHAKVRALAALLLLAPLLLRAAEALPAAPARYFNDYAGVTRQATAQQLNAQLEQFERDTSSQIIVAVFQKLPQGASLEDFTYRTATAWRVGRSGLNNGAVLFVFVQDRAMRIEVGYGLEGAIPDAIAKRIIAEEITPHFRAGNFDAGLTAGVNALMRAARGEYRGTGRTVGDSRGPSRAPWPILVFFAVFLLLAIAQASRRRGTTYGGRRRGGWGGPVIWSGGRGGSGGGWSGGGGFSGGGGSFGGGGASGRW